MNPELALQSVRSRIYSPGTPEMIMDPKPDSKSEDSFASELRVGLTGLGVAAGLITLFVTIMLWLAHMVAATFGNSLPFFLDKG